MSDDPRQKQLNEEVERRHRQEEQQRRQEEQRQHDRQRQDYIQGNQRHPNQDPSARDGTKPPPDDD